MVISDPTLRELSDYWEELRNGRAAPYRSEIDPRHFESALENMFILEHLGGSNVRIRLAGMTLCEMMGMELRGMSLRALMRMNDRVALDTALGQVLGGPCIAHLELDAHAPSGDHRPAEMILLPLRSDFGEVSRILGCLQVKGRLDTDVPPVRLSIRAANIRTIEVKAGSEPGKPPRGPGFAEPAPGFAHAPAPFRAIEGGARKPGTERRRGHLRLVDRD
ncbi:PAS domain-containing protein [Oceanicella sp. SM1341]|uniref:PAS domain-containing protein n=1 Tax=Oceanicella sp. SM1341 TaxID=1548889 RepID=UPI0013006C2F|nr:PAS domain-containing protein [Oceanicella sp. SM1341]